MPSIAVAPLLPEHRTVWEPIWKNYLAFYGTSLPAEVLSATFARLVSPEFPDCVGRLATVDGEPAGLAHVVFHHHCWQPEKICYLQDLFVEKKFRRLGVARTLIEATARLAGERQAGKVYWLTQNRNRTARKLYDRLARLTPFVKYEKPI